MFAHSPTPWTPEATRWPTAVSASALPPTSMPLATTMVAAIAPPCLASSVICSELVCRSPAVLAVAASARFLMKVSAWRASAHFAATSDHGKTVEMIVVQIGVTTAAAGPRAPNVTIARAHMIAMIAVARATIEPRMIVIPVAMSAADFSRLPRGSAFQASMLARLATPEMAML